MIFSLSRNTTWLDIAILTYFLGSVYVHTINYSVSRVLDTTKLPNYLKYG